ncbi:citrate lyase holo-[acyl-carrier protein] synthase [Enterococcus sp. DIV0086]|uniref:citrate lyase holo-[acyl-carrier protein] synthase n=1 Tax=Enterococcus sp. DIV0086 TaxID=2774655 RepID=UPI003D2D60E4
MFDTGKIQKLEDVLTHKEQRVSLQTKLLFEHQNNTLLVFTLNIPGPIKNNSEILRIFYMGKVALKKMFIRKKIHPIYTQEINLPSGLDWFVEVSTDPFIFKQFLVELEQEHPLGRIFDLDVLFFKNGRVQIVSRQDLGYPERPCFICQQAAKVCARNKTHEIKEIQKKIEQIFDIHTKEV